MTCSASSTTPWRLREEMHARFADVEGHFDAIYQRFDRLEERLSA